MNFGIEYCCKSYKHLIKILSFCTSAFKHTENIFFSSAHSNSSLYCVSEKLALEPRIVFDGAGVDTALTLAAQKGSQDGSEADAPMPILLKLPGSHGMIRNPTQQKLPLLICALLTRKSLQTLCVMMCLLCILTLRKAVFLKSPKLYLLLKTLFPVSTCETK